MIATAVEQCPCLVKAPMSGELTVAVAQMPFARLQCVVTGVLQQLGKSSDIKIFVVTRVSLGHSSHSDSPRGRACSTGPLGRLQTRTLRRRRQDAHQYQT